LPLFFVWFVCFSLFGLFFVLLFILNPPHYQTVLRPYFVLPSLSLICPVLTLKNAKTLTALVD